MLPKRRYEILQGGATVMAKVELKKPVVEEISAQIADAESVILVNYSGLTVEQDTKLRKELREAGVHYKVYKNTMMNFAFQGTQCRSEERSVGNEYGYMRTKTHEKKITQ